MWVAIQCEQLPPQFSFHCDSRSQVIAFTTFAPLVSKTLPLAAFSHHQLIKFVFGIITIAALLLCIPKFFYGNDCWIAFLLLLPSFPLIDVSNISQYWMRKWYQVLRPSLSSLTLLRTLRSIISHKNSSPNVLRSFGRSCAIHSRLSSTITRSISLSPRSASALLRSIPLPPPSFSTLPPSSQRPFTSISHSSQTRQSAPDGNPNCPSP